MGGIASTFPKLTIGFLFFGAAGVALPGTAGFIADDLLLHALWSGSVLGTILTILASGILAIATWMTCTKTFFGKPRIWKSIAIFEDLDFRDRILAFSIAFTLILLGFAPSILMGPANQILN
jgi:NADH-quinone oxidoreductase subunit M